MAADHGCRRRSPVAPSVVTLTHFEGYRAVSNVHIMVHAAWFVLILPVGAIRRHSIEGIIVTFIRRLFYTNNMIILLNTTNINQHIPPEMHNIINISSGPSFPAIIPADRLVSIVDNGDIVVGWSAVCVVFC